MLACTRIGAAHTVVFGGFSSEALSDRINDARPRSSSPPTAASGAEPQWIEGNVDKALAKPRRRLSMCLSSSGTGRRDDGRGPRSLVARHRGRSRPTAPGTDGERDIRSIILYTCGTTGKPKGINHTTAGYICSADKTSNGCSILQDDDIYWCTADIGWVTGHSYIVYGRCRPARRFSCTRARPIIPMKAASGNSSRNTRSQSSTPPPRPSAPSSSGAISMSTSTIFRACGCWARSVKASIPKPGCGITG